MNDPVAICHAPLTGMIRLNAGLRVDPSMTTMIRYRFVVEVNRLFRELKRDIRASIVDNDCFGIQPALRVLAPLPRKAFEFKWTADKVTGFMRWLEQQEEQGILKLIRRPGVLPGVESAWTDVYIDSAYQQGIRNGRARLRKSGVAVPSFDAFPGGIGGMMNQPMHADRVGIIYSRTFEDLKSVTNVMNVQTRRKITDGLTTGLARGLAEGKNPRVIARELYKDVANRVDTIGVTRARTIARTEVLHAHNTAQDAEYERAEREIGEPIWVDVSLGANPCEICIDLAAGGPYERARAAGQLPAYPNCVCVHIPRPKPKQRRGR